SAPVTVTVYPLPSSVISRSGDTLFTAAGYDHYQWYTGGQPVPGATQRVYLPVAAGAYSVAVTDSNGCSNTSASVNVDHVDIWSGNILSEDVHFYPNPSSGMVYITSAEP